MRNKLKKGFTLIEMLIVITIIAILAGIVFVGIPGFRNNALDSRRIADLRNVQNALELYYAKCRFYPGPGSNDDGTCGSAASGALVWSSEGNNLTLEKILKSSNIGITSIPHEPVSGWGGGNSYTYEAFDSGTSPGQKYAMSALLSADRDVLHDNTAEDFNGASVGGEECYANDDNYRYCVGSAADEAGGGAPAASTN